VNVAAGYWWGGSDVSFSAYGPNASYPVRLFYDNLSVIFNETLILQNYSFNSSTNVTLSMQNDGKFKLGISGYQVDDGAGDTYSCSGRQNCLVSTSCCLPFSVSSLSTPIGANCPNCILTGTAFTFTSGQSYKITINTSTDIFYDPYGPTIYMTIQR